jgi:hypothetical protein
VAVQTDVGGVELKARFSSSPAFAFQPSREIVLLTAIVVRVRLVKKDTVPAAATLRLPLRAVMLKRNTPDVLGEPTK